MSCVSLSRPLLRGLSTISDVADAVADAELVPAAPAPPPVVGTLGGPNSFFISAHPLPSVEPSLLELRPPHAATKKGIMPASPYPAAKVVAAPKPTPVAVTKVVKVRFRNRGSDWSTPYD